MERPLDRIDRRLMQALQKNARASNKELAAIAGLAPSTTHARVRRLMDEGVIEGLHAEISPDALGIGLQALIFIRLRDHSSEQTQQLWDQLVSRPEVVETFYVGGENDVMLHVAVRNTRHLEELVVGHLGGRSEISRLRTEIVFRRAPKKAWPDYHAE